MRKAKGVYTRKGSRNYQWSIKTPKDLLGDGVKSSHRESLDTEDLATANRRAAKLEHEWLERFEQQRKRRTPVPIHTVTPAVLQLIKESARHSLLSFDQQLRWDDEYLHHVCVALNVLDEARERPGAALKDIQRPAHLDIDPEHIPSPQVRKWFTDYRKSMMLERFRAMVQELKDQSSKALTLGDKHAAAEIASIRAKDCGLCIDWLTPENYGFLPEILEVEVQALNDVLARHAGEVVPTPSKPIPPVVKQPPPIEVTHTIFDALEAWKLREVKREGRTLKQYTYAAGLFAELMPGRSLESLTTACGDELTISLKHWAHSRGNNETTTHNRHGEIATLLRIATRKGWCKVFPLQDTSITKAEKTRRAWRPEDLKRLFSAPLFTAYTLPSVSRAGLDAAYWVPLLGLFTGARIGELCQLWTDDITVEADGLVIEIRPNEERGQRVKNSSSRRRVPVHSALMGLGFREYWQTIAKTGPCSLFPALPWGGADTDAGAGDLFGKWFGAFKTEQGFDASYVFHSFRHTLQTQLKKTNMDRGLINAIAGHAGRDTGEQAYTDLQPEDLRPHLELLQFPGLSLPRVFERPAWTPEWKPTRSKTTKTTKTTKT